MARQLVKLTFPAKLIKQPVTYRMARRFDVVPNIRRAKVTATVGEIIMELEGGPKNLEKGLVWLAKQGVKVEPVVGSVLE